MLSPIQKERRSVKIASSEKKRAASSSESTAKEAHTPTDSAQFNQLLRAEALPEADSTTATASAASPSLTDESHILLRAKTANLVGALNSLSDTLREDPSLRNYLLYKRTLTDILEISSSSGTFALSKYRMKTANTSIEKEFHVITIINKEMNSLLNLIRETHQDSFAIAEKLVSIKGLVLSVTL